MGRTQPRFPLYIPSKGRADTRYTVKSLEEMGVPYRIVVEEQERAAYEAVVDPAKVLVLDPQFQRDYETCDDAGDTKSKGPGPARNFIWEHSISEGHDWHWIMDDNIRGFYRLYRNQIIPVLDGTPFRCMEDFVLRYRNVAMAGPNYYMFVSRKTKVPPFVMNTRIYSCNLIRNDQPFRWRGRYNEDTILSLDQLKAGWCTVQFNAFLQQKLPTQTVKGGNTDELYHREGELKPGAKYAFGGTAAKSQMLADLHPDVAKVVWRFGRIHHHVDYRPFKANKLVRQKGLGRLPKVDNYGLTLGDRPGRRSAK